MTPDTRSQIHGWLVRVADGDRDAFGPLFDALWPHVSAYCRRVLGDAAAGDDAAQETLVRVFTRSDEFDRDRDATAWVLGIATWQCRTARRRTWRRREDPLDAAARDAVDGWSEAARRDLVRHAVAVVGTLSAADADAIAAAVSDDPAARGDVAPATFRKRLERALGRVRTAWRSRHGET